jgi:hypothetical protein
VGPDDGAGGGGGFYPGQDGHPLLERAPLQVWWVRVGLASSPSPIPNILKSPRILAAQHTPSDDTPCEPFGVAAVPVLATSEREVAEAVHGSNAWGCCSVHRKSCLYCTKHNLPTGVQGCKQVAGHIRCMWECQLQLTQQNADTMPVLLSAAKRRCAVENAACCTMLAHTLMNMCLQQRFQLLHDVAH